jgi:hypothetical protein
MYKSNPFCSYIIPKDEEAPPPPAAAAAGAAAPPAAAASAQAGEASADASEGLEALDVDEDEGVTGGAASDADEYRGGEDDADDEATLEEEVRPMFILMSTY